MAGAQGNEAKPRPDFLVIGAMKSGTTSLHRYLSSHPQIQMPRQKELHFFSWPDRWARGWSWYESQFPERLPETLAMGECSPSYSKFPEFPSVPERIAMCLPEVRLIYLLRHPVERMRSHFLHRLGAGTETRPIEAALLEDPTYLDASRYGMQIGRYREFVPPGRMLVVTSEALRTDRRAVLERVYGFLGVDAGWRDPVHEQQFYRAEDKRADRPTLVRIRRSEALRRAARMVPRGLRRALGTVPVDPAKAEMPRGLRTELEHRLRADIRALAAFMPPGFDGWGLLDG